MKGAIFLNSPSKKPIVDEYDFVLAADGGYKYALDAGVKVDLVMGDFDSLKQQVKDVDLLTFAPEKDMTDGELALRHLASLGYCDIDIYGAEGGRIDHIFYNFFLLAIADSLGVKARAVGNDSISYFVKSDFTMSVKPNTLFSIVPFSDKLHIMNTKGLYYPIHDKTLDKYSTLGVSNKTTSDSVTVNIKEGACFVIIGE